MCPPFRSVRLRMSCAAGVPVREMRPVPAANGGGGRGARDKNGA